MATDNFENTDGTLLTTHNSDWTVTGSGASNCEINDNEVFVDNIWQVAYCTHSSTVDSCMIELTGKDLLVRMLEYGHLFEDTAPAIEWT